MISKHFEIGKYKEKTNFFLFYGENDGYKNQVIKDIECDLTFKTAILASIISNKRVDVQNIYREGIEKITAQDINAANKKNYVIKLLRF